MVTVHILLVYYKWEAGGFEGLEGLGEEKGEGDGFISTYGMFHSSED